eukprot:TRINITY_DN2078_c4_g1_i1.p1 TRINITY_DN2078_c4_g1~~TRINITY_DN2078_c4_g1_i1.p1  ORF type:complete len:302 (+),score=38.29 TRINITY_DN2078_c4_g1_i1:26-907(+)
MKTLLLSSMVLLVLGYDAAAMAALEERNAEILAAPGDVEEIWCFSNDDCRQLSDESATCESGICSCTDKEDTTRLCQATENPLKEVSYTLSFTFADVDCTLYLSGVASTGFERSCKAFLSSRTDMLLVTFNFVCGSIVSVMGIRSTAVNLAAAISALKDEIVRLQGADPVLAASSLSLTVSVNPSQCAIENAVSTTLVEGACYPTQCAPGYKISSSSSKPPVHSCVSTTNNSGDDALSDTVIAGIVLAAVLSGLGLCAFVLYASHNFEKSYEKRVAKDVEGVEFHESPNEPYM